MAYKTLLKQDIVNFVPINKITNYTAVNRKNSYVLVWGRRLGSGGASWQESPKKTC